MLRLPFLLLLFVAFLPVVAAAGDEVEPNRPKPVIRSPIMVAGEEGSGPFLST
jgi:hypothetical protein